MVFNLFNLFLHRNHIIKPKIVILVGVVKTKKIKNFSKPLDFTDLM